MRQQTLLELLRSTRQLLDYYQAKAVEIPALDDLKRSLAEFIEQLELTARQEA